MATTTPVAVSCCPFNLKKRPRAERDHERDDGRRQARASGRANAMKRTTVFVMYSRPLALPRSDSLCTSTTMSFNEAVRDPHLLAPPTPSLTTGSGYSSTQFSFRQISYPLTPEEHTIRKDPTAGFSSRKEMCSIIAAVMAATPISPGCEDTLFPADRPVIGTVEDALGPLEEIIEARRYGQLSPRRTDNDYPSPCARKRRRLDLPSAGREREVYSLLPLPPQQIKLDQSVATSSSKRSQRSTLSRRYGVIFDELAFRPLELDLIKMHDLMTTA